MFRVGLKKIRVGGPTGTTHTFHLSLIFDTMTYVLREKSKVPSQQSICDSHGPHTGFYMCRI